MTLTHSVGFSWGSFDDNKHAQQSTCVKMNNLDKQQNELVTLLKTNGASLVGFTDVSDIDRK
jgi:hypothetical protein